MRISAKHLYRGLVPVKIREVVSGLRRNEMSFERLNQIICNRTSIPYGGATINLFYHAHNCGGGPERTTERSVEMALALMWLRKTSGAVIEVGAVTPYYLTPEDPLANKISRIIDPADPHRSVTDRVSLFDFDFSGANVLSISTLEHVGTRDYDLEETHRSCPDALTKLIAESATCLLTMPIGYNPGLDRHLATAPMRPDVQLTIVWRGPKFNNWRVTANRRVIEKIVYGQAWANGVAIVEK
jgi:hypothetical protein